MGLSASQARFLQLTARKSNVEYQAQQINFQRLQLTNNLTDASNEYQNAISNRSLKYKFNNGSETINVDLTYTNYKNYMNQQLEGITTTQEKLYLVSSSGKKIIVASEEERQAIIEANTTYTPITDSNNTESTTGNTTESGTNSIATNSDTAANNNDTAANSDSAAANSAGTATNADSTAAGQTQDSTDDTNQKYKISRKFVESDFLIVDNLDDTDAFQEAIKDGTYYFAKFSFDENTQEFRFKTEPWETIGGNVITEDYDKSDDAAAEAKFDHKQKEIQKADKKLELELSKLETERNAIQTEMDSVSKVVDDNIEKSFKVFG